MSENNVIAVEMSGAPKKHKPYVYLERFPHRRSDEAGPEKAQFFRVHIAFYTSYSKFEVFEFSPQYPVPIGGIKKEVVRCDEEMREDTTETDRDTISQFIEIPYPKNISSRRVIDIVISDNNLETPKLFTTCVSVDASTIDAFLETGVQVIVRTAEDIPDEGGSTTVNYGDADDDD